ncbi:acyl-ACP--UDP-N-acetylglucosamine O-acyltransferase [Maricaulis sp.]|uniref:acyl-ACP--UDP-N-acetylglucosamine O-acyltransferase n=1 Tax=Maricaulis sp. TaxID=1486257 RepID=UPI003A8EF4F2
MTATTIHETAIVAPEAKIGAGVEIGPFCIVGPNVVLHDRVRLVSHATVAGFTEIGEDCVLYPGVHLGHPPQDFKFQGEETWLIVGQRNIVREGVTMHPGTAFDKARTVVGNDCYFMAGSHIAHDCIVGDRVVLANGAQIAGSSSIGDHVIFGGLSGVVQKTRVGRHAFIGAMTKVAADVIPYGSVNGNDAHLVGLNVVGLKRRGMPRDALRDLRAAYRLLFAEEGTFQERLSDASELYSDNEHVMEIIGFIRASSNRALVMPNA